MSHTENVNTLKNLLWALKSDDDCALDWSSLPTFGGPDIEDTTGVWSWDADSVLLTDPSGQLAIWSREDLEEYRAEANA